MSGETLLSAIRGRLDLPAASTTPVENKVATMVAETAPAVINLRTGDVTTDVTTDRGLKRDITDLSNSGHGRFRTRIGLDRRAYPRNISSN
jgi:hypothetical protein